MIEVKNPHSILAALESRPGSVQKLQISLSDEKGDSQSIWKKILELASSQKVPVHKGAGSGSRSGGKDKDSSQGGRVGHSFAMLRPKESVPVEKLFQSVNAQNHRVWIALDSLHDPHNVGAIFRTASFLGVAGVLMTEERSAPLSGVAYDVSCGGIEALPFAQIVNLKQGLEKAKDSGLWILGTSEHSQGALKDVHLDRSWLVVFGNEEKGLRRLTLESCDLVCSVPRQGRVDSLNVSVAAGIVLSRLTF